MSSFSQTLRDVSACLTAAGIRNGVATSLGGIDVFTPEGPKQPEKSSDAYIVVDSADLSRANAVLTAAGYTHRVVDTLDVFLDRPDTPLKHGVIVATPLDAPLVRPLDMGELRKHALRRAAHARREGPVEVSARKQIDLLIARHIAPGLRATGFKKSARSFGRHVGSLIHVINFQGSQWIDDYAASFYINIGIWSESIARLSPYQEVAPHLDRPLPKSGVPSPTYCHSNGRIEDLAPQFRTFNFECIADDPNEAVATAVCQAIFEHALPFFDAITSDEDLLRHSESTAQARLCVGSLWEAALYRLARPASEFDACFERIKAEWQHADADAVSKIDRVYQRLKTADVPIRHRQ